MVVAAVVTGIVVAVVRRSPSTATRAATQPGVLFLVTARGWQTWMLRGVSLASIAAGLICVLVGSITSDPGPIIGGVIIALAFGVPFLLLANWLHGTRLEVTEDAVWVFKGLGKRELVPLSRITRFTAQSGNYGGIVARTGEKGLFQKKLFQANRTMLGYPQLIDYLSTRRPDLEIPAASWPLQDPYEGGEPSGAAPRHGSDQN